LPWIGKIRWGGNPAPNDLVCRRMTAAVNIALHKVAPAHVRIDPIRRSPKDNLTAAAALRADANMLLAFKETILQAARNHDQSIVEIRANETGNG